MMTRRRPAVVEWFFGLAALLSLFGGAATSAEAASVLSGADPAGVIRSVRLAEPLVRTGPTTGAEDAALASAIATYERRTQPGDVGSLAAFVSRYPRSGWTPAVQTNLGILYLHDGYLSRAIDSWRGAWTLGKRATEPHAKALVDRALGELMRLESSLGQFKDVSVLFDEMDKRPVSGSATEAVQAAREELTLVSRDPRHLFNCGPVALEMLMLASDPSDTHGAGLEFYRAGPNGTNLEELAGLATRAKFAYRLIWRRPGQPVPTLAIVHWKLGHYGTIVGEAHGRYHVEDAAAPGSGFWVTQAALDTESSGYFLVPASARTDAGWRAVAAKEAVRIWGRGPTSGVQPGDANDPTARNNQNRCPLCGYDIKEATVGVTLSDLPVGFSAPIGPSGKVRITYNQREDSQPAVFGFYNVSPKWTLNFLTYVTDDPTAAGSSVTRYLTGGGAYYYSGYSSGTGQFTAQSDDGSILVLASTGPITYRRLLPDGGVEVYAQSDGSTSYPRNVFLSEVVDAQGNALTLSYDTSDRLVSFTDATGRSTTFTYGLSAQPLLVTQITDPFGRSANLTYDTSGRLSSITDILGLTSSFAYDSNSLIDAMTTPYGTTSFAYTAPGTSAPPRFVQVTDPLGYHERGEWLEPASIPDSDPSASVPVGMPVTLENAFLTYRDSFYWDRNAYVVAGCAPTGGCDYTKARDRHFNHTPLPATGIKSTSIESVKYPLENRIWFTYPGQSLGIYAGTSSQPTGVGRVLDDGSTQLTLNSYDTAGFYKLRQTIDPLGRITTFSYANQVDLSAIAQTTAYGVRTTIHQWTYNSQHRPIVHTDAAGQTTRLTYNAAGQVTSVTNPLNQTTSNTYDSAANITSITNANSVTAEIFTYDSFDRLATYTDSEGWTIGYNYDSADRLINTTYPDGTSDTFTYDKLDLVAFQDRIGREWTYAYDADRRLTTTTDPVGNQSLFAYNPIDEVTSRTDPNSNVTQWAYDVEGRLTTKTYADSSTVATAYESTTSRVHTVTDALSQVKQFAYAQDDRLATVTYVAAVNPTPNVSFAYDPFFPRLVSRTDGTGVTQYSYVPVGSPGALKVAQDTTPLTAGTITYAYDALGRLTSRTVAGSGAETFAYDSLGRLTSHASDLGSFTLSYLGQTNQITSRQLASSTLATTWSYLTNAADRRLASVSSVGLSSSQHSAFTYTTNAGNLTTGATQTSDTAISYPPGSLTQTANYTNLNQVGNLYNPPPTPQPYSYDANGNLLSDGARTYSWDAENRLVAIAYPGLTGKVTTFAYDGLGRRISISSTPTGGSPTTTTSYIWCGSRPCQARDASNAVIKAYYAEGEFVPGSPGQPYYYGQDRLGSTRRVFSSSGAPTYDYDPYGAPLQTTVPVTDFVYAGTFYNADSGLYLTPSRVYDPFVGRWLSRDPAGEGSDAYGNLYAYVEGDPLNKGDPEGLYSSIPLTIAERVALGEEIGGGGPEDPVADVAALATLAVGFAWANLTPDQPPNVQPNSAGGAGGSGKRPPGALGSPCPPSSSSGGGSGSSAGGGGSGASGGGSGSGGDGNGANGGSGGSDNFTSRVQQAIQDQMDTGGSVTNIVGGPDSIANLDPELGPSQVRYYVNFSDEFGSVTTYSLNYDPETGEFGTIKPSSGPLR